MSERWFGLRPHPPHLTVHVGDGRAFIMNLAERLLAANQQAQQNQQRQEQQSQPRQQPPSEADAASAATLASSSPEALPQPYDVIVLDVDSKDVTAGLSCPPAAFLERPFLRAVVCTPAPFDAALFFLVSAVLVEAGRGVHEGERVARAGDNLGSGLASDM